MKDDAGPSDEELLEVLDLAKYYIQLVIDEWDGEETPETTGHLKQIELLIARIEKRQLSVTSYIKGAALEH